MYDSGMNDLLPKFFARCSDILAKKNWGDLADLAAERNQLAASGICDETYTSHCHAIMRELPLYHIAVKDTQLGAELATAWRSGPKCKKWQWANLWIPCTYAPWQLERQWPLDHLADDEIASVLAFMLRRPIGWREAGESDRYNAYLAALLPEIRQHAATSGEKRQAIIDQTILDHLNIQMALFGSCNMRPLAEARARLLEDVLQRVNPTLSLSLPPRKQIADTKNGKIKLGIAIRYFSPFIDNSLLAGLLQALPRDRYALTVYSLQDVDQRIDHEAPDQKIFQQNFMTLIDHHSALDTLPLETIVNRIREDEQDIILIGSALHASTAKAHLAIAYRLAPVQISPSIPSCSCGFSSIDYFATSKSTEPPDAQSHYTERLLYMDHHFYALALDPAPAAIADYQKQPADADWYKRHGVTPDTPILVSGAGWPKLTPEALDVWVSILDAVPQAHLFLDANSPSWPGGWFASAQKAYLTDLLKAQNIDPVRCHIFAPSSNRERIGLLAHATLYLDSFPYSGSMALREPLLLGCPVIVRETPHQRGLQAAATLRSLGLDDFVAANDDMYRQLAVAFLNDPSKQIQARARIKEAVRYFVIYRKSPSEDFAKLLAALPKTGTKA